MNQNLLYKYAKCNLNPQERLMMNNFHYYVAPNPMVTSIPLNSIPSHLTIPSSLSAITSTSVAPCSDMNSSSDSSNCPDKTFKRREANRLAQRKSRLKKDEIKEHLIQENNRLKEEIRQLRGQLSLYKPHNEKKMSFSSAKDLDKDFHRKMEMKKQVLEKVDIFANEIKKDLLEMTTEDNAKELELSSISSTNFYQAARTTRDSSIEMMEIR